MIRLAYLGVAVAAPAYVIALIFLDETASDIGNAAMLTAAVALLFRIHSLLGQGAVAGGGPEPSS